VYLCVLCVEVFKKSAIYDNAKYTHPRILQGNGGQQKILQPKTINGGQHKDVTHPTT